MKRRARDKVKIKGLIVVVLQNAKTGKVDRVITMNIVTTKGQIYYAQRSGEESPTYDFTAGGLKLGDDNTPPTQADDDVTSYIADTYKVVYSGYPKTNDTDPLNPGGGTNILTWRYFYICEEAVSASIYEGAIVDQEESPGGALTHFVFADPIEKTDKQTLTVFVNHEFLGGS